MISIVIISFFIFITLIVLAFLYRRRQQSQSDPKIDLDGLVEDANKVDSTFDLQITDEDLRVNDVFLMDGVATPDATIEFLKEIGTSVGASIGALGVFHISKRGIQILGKTLVKSGIAAIIKKTLPKAALKAATALSKSAAKLSNPIGWALMYFDAVSAIWDITDVGKLSNYKDALQWMELRDLYKAEFDKAIRDAGGDPSKKRIIGPLSKLQATDENKWLQTYTAEFEAQITRWADKIVNERKSDIEKMTEQQIVDLITGEIEKNQDKITNITFRILCEKEGGTYLGGSICSYKDKQSCDSSFSWPLKDGEQYGQWDGQKCVFEPWAGAVRTMCEAEGTANIGYDYNRKACVIKEPYCTQFGYQYKPVDQDADSQPNCYKELGRKIADALVGETISQDFQNLFSQEVNCGGRCTDDQYCYTISGRGGLCVQKHKVGEGCPMDHPDVACEGQSKCKLNSEGIAAIAGFALANVATAGIAGAAGAAAAAAAGRSIAANMGMCTAGQDGVNPSSTDNPGHYIPLEKSGCGAAWPCPPKVDQNGKKVHYHCANVFEPCKPPVNDGEFCLAGQHHWCKEGSFCGGDSRCKPKNKGGERCVVPESCISGECVRDTGDPIMWLTAGISGTCSSESKGPGGPPIPPHPSKLVGQYTFYTGCPTGYKDNGQRQCEIIKTKYTKPAGPTQKCPDLYEDHYDHCIPKQINVPYRLSKEQREADEKRIDDAKMAATEAAQEALNSGTYVPGRYETGE